MKILKILLILLLVMTTGLFVLSTAYYESTGRDVPPRISCEEGVLEVSAQHTDEDLLAGLTASDQQDGDLTGQIMVAGVSKLISKDTAKVTYLVFDSDNNMASLTRLIRYTDYSRPTILIRQPLIFSSEDTAAITENLEAIDVIDGDISESLRISTLWATRDSDVYSVTVQVTNSMGDTSRVDLPVIIQPTDPTRPVINLTHQMVYLSQGSEFDPMDCLQSVTRGNIQLSTADVTIENNVNTEVPDTYWVCYRYASGDASALAILTVVVQ